MCAGEARWTVGIGGAAALLKTVWWDYFASCKPADALANVYTRAVSGAYCCVAADERAVVGDVGASAGDAS